MPHYRGTAVISIPKFNSVQIKKFDLVAANFDELSALLADKHKVAISDIKAIRARRVWNKE